MRPDVQTLNAARSQSRTQERDMSGFDYAVSAELYPSRIRKTGRPFAYRRFNTAAEAIRFIVEEAPAEAMLGACLEVDEKRFSLQDVQRLYESDGYPLPRTPRG
jgi:hypothetical protein